VAAETVVVLAPFDPALALLGPRQPRVRPLVPPAGEAHTPGANRNRGAAGATAPYLGFVDGDAELDPGFLAAALARLEAEPSLAGAGGRIHERQWEGARLVREIPDSYRSRAGGPVEMLATAWVARRSAFEAVGGFDPRLPAEEDVELCIRLADAGHPVVALDRRAAYHDGPPRPSLAEFRRRWRSGLYAGQGLLLRHTWGTPRFARHFARQGLYLGALAFVALGAFLALSSLLGVRRAPGALATWFGTLALAVVVMAVRKRSLTLGALSIATWIVLGAGIVRAWALGPRGAT
jgi:cellulose synthase/poly-beta-1,6-N-acetylglucosamine synthase-like glycosyltransferase